MRVRRLLVPYAALALLLAGCGGDSTADPPSPTNPTTTTPSTTGSTSPTSPSASETAAVESPEKFIRRFVKVQNRMTATGNTQAFAEMCTPDGRYCRAAIGRIREIYDAGGNIDTKGWSVVSARLIGRHAGGPVYRVIVDSAATDYLESSSSEPQHFDGGRVIYRFYLQEEDGSLRLDNIAEVAE